VWLLAIRCWVMSRILYKGRPGPAAIPTVPTIPTEFDVRKIGGKYVLLPRRDGRDGRDGGSTGGAQ
jgi:hypothetical protein